MGLASCNLGETFLCNTNLQSLLLSLRRSLTRRLSRLLRANPRPARPVKKSKKTKHEKGMTTGKSSRSGANKGGAANPSDQDGAGSGADNMAAPKSGRKY